MSLTQFALLLHRNIQSGDIDALRERFNEDGFLFLPGIIPKGEAIGITPTSFILYAHSPGTLNQTPSLPPETRFLSSFPNTKVSWMTQGQMYSQMCLM